MQQPVLVMFSLGIACALRADYAGRVIVVLGTVHAPDGALVDKFDFERAGRGAVVRAGRIADPLSSAETGGMIHAPVHYRDDCCHREGVDSETAVSPQGTSDFAFHRANLAPVERRDVSSWRQERLGSAGLADDLVFREELRDFARRGLWRVGTVHGVFADRLRVHLAYRAGGSLGRLGRRHKLAIASNRVLAL